MKPNIFNEITGSTHGIRLRIRPPRKPNARYFAISEAVELCAVVSGAAAAAGALGGSGNCHATRSAPSGAEPKTSKPNIDNLWGEAGSIGTRRVTSEPLRDWSFG